MASYEQPSQPPEVVEFGLPLIQDATVQGLGETALICLYPERVKGMYTGRWHQQHTVELDGHKHSVLVTNPSAHYSQTDVYFFPGFTQTTDEPALVDNECGNYPVRVIAGGRDPLTQPAMWEAEQTAHPSNVSLTIIAGRGHGMAADSVGAARAFSRTLSIMDTAA